ncbi:hypothetical protein CFC21_091070 [Triticum aestivum]|uniref:DUF4220 domain-containing protein n=2 Tax=Triticum aestivum TaxID=4565 RepID=A0A9R1MSM8_WHEAT|nr:hypothetical protein CFC21_091070 [Triticum aestivum]
MQGNEGAPPPPAPWSLMAGMVSLWNDWEVQVLVLFSFVLQVFLLMFARMRRRNISIVPRTLIWLAYLLADSIAIYILGHMSFCSKPHEYQQLAAFWTPFLLMHLGGQDTVTAYAMEDNYLWPRHLLSLIVQALGVAYVLYKYTTGSRTLVTGAVLIFVAGILKYAERVWALKSANLENISNLLESRKFREARQQDQIGPYRPRERWGQAEQLGSEEILQGAHDLLPICMGQFMDYKFWPSPFQSKAIRFFGDKGYTYELIEMQLSLMHDVLYTKAVVINTWWGCFIRAISLVAIIATFFLFRSSTSKNVFIRVDVVVTYILLGGAFLLEMTAVLRAIGSTWMCALLRAGRWDWLHHITISARRYVKAGKRSRRWSGSIGQHKFLQLQLNGPSVHVTIGPKQGNSFVCWDLWKKIHPSLTVISDGTKELVLKEILRMVKACAGKEEIMTSYSGPLVEAIRELSNYMIFLLVERPYMLPSPVRPGLYANTEVQNVGWSSVPILYANTEIGSVEWGRRGAKNLIERIKSRQLGSTAPPALARGAELARLLLDMEERGVPGVLQVILGVWVEMMCYAAHHCSRDSHARQLNSGGEFITVIWLLSTAMFNRTYCGEPSFKEDVNKFFRPLFADKPTCLQRFVDQSEMFNL